jgi:DNA-binding CsgD family transcriptional regulator
MSRSQRLCLHDVRAVFRLVGEVRELGEDPLAWRRHLAEALARLVGAKLTFSVEAVTTGPAGTPVPVGIADVGWADEQERRLLLRYGEDPDRGYAPDWPEWPQCVELMQRQPSFTRRRRQLVEDSAWYRCPHVQEIRRRGCRVDDFLYSSVWVAPAVGVVDVLAMHRPWGDKPFEPLQHRLVHLLHDELRRVCQIEPAAAGPGPLADLTPRERQTLAQLLAGASEKEAARHLGLSRNTIHHYVVALYRHFHVYSRAELLAHCHRLARPAFRLHLFLASSLH